jgi:succinyl-diaminopimelate desuccinylase
MNPNNPALTLLQSLIRLPSVTPQDAGCQVLIATRLAALGFSITHLPFGTVNNLWAKRGTTAPLFVFAGHTDVVPPGPENAWQTPPFEPTIRGDVLYGRGAADMKGSIAAMIVACERFVAKHPNHPGSIAFLLTSDEEGPAIDGTRKVVEHLKSQGEKITWCLVGEPSSEKQVGDTLKIGRRGSLNAKLTILGKQGHIAYPQHADNPIHRCFAALEALVKTTWDNGHPAFPATCFQLSNIHAGTGVTNVIPGSLEATFNFRYSPAVTVESLQAQVAEILAQHQLRYTLDWSHSGAPFLTPAGKLLDTTQQAIQKTQQITPVLSTEGGTSDGRFIAPLGCELLELGPVNASIHQVDEHISVTALAELVQIYEDILVGLFSSPCGRE